MHQTDAAQRESMGRFLQPQVSEDYLAVIEDFDKAEVGLQLSR